MRCVRAFLVASIAVVVASPLSSFGQSAPVRPPPPTSPNAAPNAGDYAVPRVRWAKGIAASADRIWIAGGNEGLIVLSRGEPPRRVVGPEAAVAIGASRSGTIAVIGYDGRIHRVQGDRWTAGPNLSSGGMLRVAGLAIADDGAVHVATEEGGFASWTARGVTTVPYGRQRARVHGFVLAPDGTAYVTGRERLFLEITDGQARVPSFAAAAFQALAADYEELGAMWVSPSSGRLWIGTSGRRLLEVDRARGTVTVHTVPAFGMMRVIVGYGSGADETIIVAAQSEIVVRRRGTTSTVPGSFSFPEGMHVEPRSETLWIVNRDGVHRFSLRESRLLPATAVAVTAELPTVSIVAPDAPVTRQPPADPAAPTTTESPRAPDPQRPPPPRDGVRLHVVSLRHCGVLGAVTVSAQVQPAGTCLRPGQSVELDLGIAAGRATRIEVRGAPRSVVSCVRSRLRRMRVLADRCEASFRIERP